VRLSSIAKAALSQAIFFGILFLGHRLATALLFREELSVLETLRLARSGLLYDLAIATLFALMSITLSRAKAVRNALIVGLLLALMGDLWFFSYSGRHFDRTFWAYIERGNWGVILSSAGGMLNGGTLAGILLVIAGVTVFLRFFARRYPVLHIRGTPFSWAVIWGTGLLCALFSLWAGNRIKQGDDHHRSGLSENFILVNLNQLLFEPPPAFPDQGAFSGFRSIFGGEDPDFPWIRDSKMLSCQNPLGSARKKNLIFVFLESAGALSATPWSPLFRETTPELQRLVEEGVPFWRTLMGSTPTAGALVSSLCSFLDQDSLMRTRGHTRLLCLPEVLRGKGYETVFLVNAGIAYDGMDRFMRQNGFSQVIGESDFDLHSRPPRPLFGQFGLHDDRQLFSEALARIQARDSARPFFLSIVTSANHDPFPEYGGDFVSREGKGKRRRMHGSMRFMDRALGEFVRQLKKDVALYRDTVLFIFADHPPWFRESLAENPWAHDPVGATWIPAVVLNAPELRRSAFQSKHAWTSQMDLVPTALDILGVCVPRAPWAGVSWLSNRSPEARVVFSALRNRGEILAARGEDLVLMREEGGGKSYFRVPREGPPRVSAQGEVANSALELARVLEATVKINRWATQENRIWRNPVEEP
jgi:hypothetical protein